MLADLGVMRWVLREIAERTRGRPSLSRDAAFDTGADRPDRRSIHGLELSRRINSGEDRTRADALIQVADPCLTFRIDAA